MYEARECQSQAEHYARLAERAGSRRERDRLLRMKRAYELMARGAEFNASLDELMRRLKAPRDR